MEPSAGVPVGSDGSLRVLARYSRGIPLKVPARRAGSAQRTQAGVAGRSARERPSRVARSGRSPGRPPKAEVPLSALLPPTSWARKKSARLPGRVPAISAAESGTSGVPRRGAKKAPPGAARNTREKPPPLPERQIHWEEPPKSACPEGSSCKKTANLPPKGRIRLTGAAV